jgi:hypothetical protein
MEPIVVYADPESNVIKAVFIEQIARHSEGALLGHRVERINEI